ncbi:RNA helicase Mov10l1-like [Diadema setosum]|uniref:RNA helicase Mov10l1-like n=1 Tax=Diadema setosum TaxID=31175 RepID=UPI003B3B7D04
MFSTIATSLARLWGGKDRVEDQLPADGAEIEAGPLYPLGDCPDSYSYGYEGGTQPQFGYHRDPLKDASSNDSVGVQFQVGGDGGTGISVPAYGTRTVNGKITHLYLDYGLIDNTIHFSFDAVRPGNRPKVGAKVEAAVRFGGHEDVGLRAHEVTVYVGDWDDSTAVVEEVEWIIGKVTRAEKTSGIIDGSIMYDQDACPYGFSPYRGDWVLMEMMVGKEGEARRVRTLRPLREKRFVGYITHVYPGYGFIDSSIYFNFKACERNYRPQKDDFVEGKAVESDQSKGQWRAVFVTVKKQFRQLRMQQFPANSFKENEMSRDKSFIEVTVDQGLCKMAIGQETTKVLSIRNTGQERCKLLQCEAVCLLADIRLVLDGTVEEQPQYSGSCKVCRPTDIEPGSKVCVKIGIMGRHVGNSSCQVVMTFDTCCITRPIPLTIVDGAVSSSEPQWRLTGKDKWLREHATETSGCQPELYPGIRPARSVQQNRNPPVKLEHYPISRLLKQCCAEGRDVTELVPELKEALSLKNYFKFFSTLLHLEEIQREIDMREFDMEKASMRPRGEFLSLEVPGLAEGRPSVLVGDKVILTQPFCGQSGSRFEGFVHEIHSEDILLKFHPSFHETYGAEEFTVMFTFSRTPLRRFHQAAEFAVNLGEQALFPSDLQPKPPQEDISFVSVQQSVVYPGRTRPIDVIRLPVPPAFQESSRSTDSPPPPPPPSTRSRPEMLRGGGDSEEPIFVVPNALVDRVGTSVGEEPGMGTSEEVDAGKSEFFNKKLNVRQRAAVTRILRGEGRPTPYVLFGPPGTGKTVTLVEAILQIHHHLSSSRLLVCTPSNSAADLLTERLHLSGRVKIVDMIRLNSFRRVEENIPPSIHQYCTVGDELQALAHRRIIISTCATAGQFYSLGLKAGHFTHVLVDEAGQATEPEAVVAMGLAVGPEGQVVLAGDPMQLGPVLANREAGELGLEQSLLERLMKRDLYRRDPKKFRDHGGYNPLLVTKLVNNYRSHPMLLTLPSKRFYHNELNACANIEMREMLCGWSVLPNQGGCPFIFHGIQGMDIKEGNSPSWCNPAEAVQAVTYLQQLLNDPTLHLKETDIGIITPYRKQVEKINQLLDTFEILDTKVGSVEEFQGQERLVIIISTVRSSTSLMAFDVRHQLGFLSNPKRFNVSITRPQALLIIVGNPHLLVNDSHWRALLKYCLENKAYTGCEPPTKELIKRLDGPEDQDGILDDEVLDRQDAEREGTTRASTEEEVQASNGGESVQEKGETQNSDLGAGGTAAGTYPGEPGGQSILENKQDIAQSREKIEGETDSEGGTKSELENNAAPSEDTSHKTVHVEDESESEARPPSQLEKGLPSDSIPLEDTKTEDGGREIRVESGDGIQFRQSENGRPLKDETPVLSAEHRRGEVSEDAVGAGHQRGNDTPSSPGEGNGDWRSEGTVTESDVSSAVETSALSPRFETGSTMSHDTEEVWDSYDNLESLNSTSDSWGIQDSCKPVDTETFLSRGWYEVDTGQPSENVEPTAELSSPRQNSCVSGALYPSHTKSPHLPRHHSPMHLTIPDLMHSPEMYNKYQNDCEKNRTRGGFSYNPSSRQQRSTNAPSRSSSMNPRNYRTSSHDKVDQQTVSPRAEQRQSSWRSTNRAKPTPSDNEHRHAVRNKKVVNSEESAASQGNYFRSSGSRTRPHVSRSSSEGSAVTDRTRIPSIGSEAKHNFVSTSFGEGACAPPTIPSGSGGTKHGSLDRDENTGEEFSNTWVQAQASRTQQTPKRHPAQFAKQREQRIKQDSRKSDSWGSKSKDRVRSTVPNQSARLSSEVEHKQQMVGTNGSKTVTHARDIPNRLAPEQSSEGCNSSPPVVSGADVNSNKPSAFGRGFKLSPSVPQEMIVGASHSQSSYATLPPPGAVGTSPKPGSPGHFIAAGRGLFMPKKEEKPAAHVPGRPRGKGGSAMGGGRGRGRGRGRGLLATQFSFGQS